MSDPERERQIEERLNAATDGPWTAQPMGSPRGWFVCTDDDSPETWVGVAECEMDRQPANAAFIANTPQDIAYLLSALREERASLKELIEAADTFFQMVKSGGPDGSEHDYAVGLDFMRARDIAIAALSDSDPKDTTT